MDPRQGSQNSTNCDLCKSLANSLYCETCQINLCTGCTGNHLLDSSARHQIIPFEKRDSAVKYSICKEHPTWQCKLHCEECAVFVCVHCVTSSKHENHKMIDSETKFKINKGDLQKDLHELENYLSNKYKEITKDIGVRKSELETHFNLLGNALRQLKKQWYDEIDKIISKLEKKLDKIKINLCHPLLMQQDEIEKNILEINQSISDIKDLLQSDEVCKVSAYKSNIAKFRNLPPKLKIYLPNFSPPVPFFNKFWERFETFTDSYITRDSRGYFTGTTHAEVFPFKRFLDEPLVVKTLKTWYRGFTKELRSVICNDKSEFWTSGNNCIIKLYSIEEKLLTSIETESGNEPRDIATTKNGELVYTDPNDKSVNIVKNKLVENVISSIYWKPRNVCCTSDGDLLVIMDNSNSKETKVARYSGSKETQHIQFNDKHQPLFSFGDNMKYLSENRNQDVCVADNGSHAVVVVNRAGKLRFTYSGPNPIVKGSFDPYGVATDSQGMILTADSSKHRIHILDQDGQFLSYIDNCDLHYPWGICIDKKDNLFVAENRTGSVKIIKYYS